MDFADNHFKFPFLFNIGIQHYYKASGFDNTYQFDRNKFQEIKHNEQRIQVILTIIGLMIGPENSLKKI